MAAESHGATTGSNSSCVQTTSCPSFLSLPARSGCCLCLSLFLRRAVHLRCVAAVARGGDRAAARGAHALAQACGATVAAATCARIALQVERALATCSRSRQQHGQWRTVARAAVPPSAVHVSAGATATRLHLSVQQDAGHTMEEGSLRVARNGQTQQVTTHTTHTTLATRNAVHTQAANTNAKGAHSR